MNLTDIDDKTILKSQKEKKTLKELTEFYTQGFLKDIKSLNILDPRFTKATDYINEMIEIIKKLIKNGLAYKSKDKSIYFDIRKFKNYGKLSHLVLEKQIPFYRERMLVKPGATGWDQISGEYHSPSYEDSLKKLQYDLFYIKNRSFYLDLSIVLKTIATILSRTGM